MNTVNSTAIGAFDTYVYYADNGSLYAVESL